MSEKTNQPRTDTQRSKELNDAEMTKVAGGTDSRSSNFEEIRSDSDRSAMEGGAGFDFVQVNGSN